MTTSLEPEQSSGSRRWPLLVAGDYLAARTWRALLFALACFVFAFIWVEVAPNATGGRLKHTIQAVLVATAGGAALAIRRPSLADRMHLAFQFRLMLSALVASVAIVEYLMVRSRYSGWIAAWYFAATLFLIVDKAERVLPWPYWNFRIMYACILVILCGWIVFVLTR